MVLFAYNLVIILIAILFAYLSWRKIEFGIWAIVFLLPAYLLRFAVYGIPTTVLEMMIYILFFIWLAKKSSLLLQISAIWRKRSHAYGRSAGGGQFRNNHEFIALSAGLPRPASAGLAMTAIMVFQKEKALFLGILLLISGAAISTLLSSDLKTSAGILKGWFFDPLLLFIIIVSAIKNHGQAINLLKVFSLSGFAVAVVSMLYWFGLLPNGVSYDSRLHAFYTSPNYLAMYLAVPFIIAVWLFFKLYIVFYGVIPSEARNPLDMQNSEAKRFLPACWRVEMTKYLYFLFQRDKIFWLISTSVMAISIYLTYSYAAWFAIFIAIALLFYFTAGVEKKLSFQRKLSFLSIFLVLAVLFFSQSGASKFETLKNLSYRSSANSRLMIWRSALAIGQDHPVFGIGPGNFQKHYLDYQIKFAEPYLEWAVPEPHNIFLAFWLETGILGLAGFILILVWFFQAKIPSNPYLPAGRSLLQREGVRPTPNPSQEGNKYPPLKRGIKGDLSVTKTGLLIVLKAVMAYILLHGLFDTTYWKNDLAIIFWLILGLMIAIKKTAK